MWRNRDFPTRIMIWKNMSLNLVKFTDWSDFQRRLGSREIATLCQGSSRDVGLNSTLNQSGYLFTKYGPIKNRDSSAGLVKIRLLHLLTHSNKWTKIIWVQKWIHPWYLSQRIQNDMGCRVKRHIGNCPLTTSYLLYVDKGGQRLTIAWVDNVNNYIVAYNLPSNYSNSYDRR